MIEIRRDSTHCDAPSTPRSVARDLRRQPQRTNRRRPRRSEARRPFREAEFRASRAWGIATAIDMYGCDPDAIRNAELIERFTRELCDMLQVKRFGEPRIVRFGNDPTVYGYSMVQLIETSLVSAHFAEESNAVYLDIFSCKWYNAEVAAEFARKPAFEDCRNILGDPINRERTPVQQHADHRRSGVAAAVICTVRGVIRSTVRCKK